MNSRIMFLSAALALVTIAIIILLLFNSKPPEDNSNFPQPSAELQSSSKITLKQACLAILRDLDIPLSSEIGIKLSNQELKRNADNPDRYYVEVKGQPILFIKLDTMQFSVININAHVFKRPPYNYGELYYASDQLLKARLFHTD